MARRTKKYIAEIQTCFKPIGNERTLKLSLSLLRSDAYRALFHDARLVLQDWIDQYNGVTDWENTPSAVQRDGLTFTWGHCTLDISERLFLRARREIIRVGFFESPPELQTHAPGAAIRYRASRRWITYVATDDERNARKTAQAYKAARLSEKRTRRREFIERKPTASRAVTKDDHRRQERGNHEPGYRRNRADACPRMEGSYRRNRAVLRIQSPGGSVCPVVFEQPRPALVSAKELTRLRRLPRWYQVKSRRKLADTNGRKADLANVAATVSAHVIAAVADLLPVPWLIWGSVEPSLAKQMVDLGVRVENCACALNPSLTVINEGLSRLWAMSRAS